MHNKVVYQAAKSLDALGIPVLRFNFRGMGLSAGAHARGFGELATFAPRWTFLLPSFLVCRCYSRDSVSVLGSACRVGCEDPRVSHLIGLGIPVNSTDFSFLRKCDKPKFVRAWKQRRAWRHRKSQGAHLRATRRQSPRGR